MFSVSNLDSNYYIDMCFSSSSGILWFFSSKKRRKTRSTIYYNSAQKKGKYFLSMLGIYSKGEGTGNDRLDLNLTIKGFPAAISA